MIISIGSLEYGHTLIGPFSDAGAAEEWLKTSPYVSDHYELLPLEVPCECDQERCKQIAKEHGLACDPPGETTVTTKSGKWLYVHTTTAERAREFFGLPPDAEVRTAMAQHQENGCFAVWAPDSSSALKVFRGHPVEPIERFHRCREKA